MADEKLSARAYTTDPTDGDIHVIKHNGSIWQSFKIKISDILATVTATLISVVDINNYFNGDNVEDVLSEIGETRNENGFDLINTDTVPDLSFNSSTREFTCSKKTGQISFHLWLDSKKIVKTANESITIPDATGTYYIIYNNSANLIAVLMPNLLPINFYENAIVGLVYWNAEVGGGFSGSETHGKLMDSRTHHYNHSTFGARYESGIDIVGLADATPIYTQSTDGYIWDEDIRHTISSLNTHQFMYRLGVDGGWVFTTPNNNISYNNGGTYDVWNEFDGSTWKLSEGGGNTDYWIIFGIAIPDLTGNSVKKIIGQSAYKSRSTARAAIADEVNNISLGGLPSPEFVFLWAWIAMRNGDLEDDGSGVTYYDLRSLKGGTAGANTAINDKLKISLTDINHNYLNDKLAVSGGLAKSIINPAADEQLQIELPTTIIKDVQNFSGQAHGGNSLEVFSASKTFDANDGNNQKMLVTASTTIAISNELPGTYLFILEIDTVTPPTITIGASFGDKLDNSADLINADNDINILTLLVDSDGNKYYTINTKTA